MTFGSAVSRGLRNVSTFKGRDTRAEFWPYCGAVLGAWFVAGNVVFVVVFIGTAVAGESSRRPWSFLLVSIVSAAIVIALLGAAVTRRLHDRGHSGAWALIPFALICTAFVLFAILAATFDEDMGAGLFLAAFGNNLLYFASMVVLTVQLALPAPPPSTSGE